MNRFLPLKWSAAVLFAGTVLLAGCNRPVGSVTGKVTYQNKPLKGGSVAFVSTEGLTSVAGNIADDGTYTIGTVTAGNYKVCVDTSFLKPQPGAFTGGAKAPKAAAPAAGDVHIPEGYKPSNPGDAAAFQNAKRYIEIPEKYKDSDKSELTYTVVGGAQTHDIELK